MVVVPRGPEAASPVTLELAKAQCRVTHAHDDAYFSQVCIPSAMTHLRKLIDRPILRRSFEALDSDSGPYSISGLGPFSVTEVALISAGSTVNVLPAAEYRVGKYGEAMIISLVNPKLEGDVVRIRFDVGMDPVPQDLVDAALLLVHSAYIHRGATDSFALHRNPRFEALIQTNTMVTV